MNLPLHQIIPETPTPLYTQVIDPSGRIVCSAGGGVDAPAGGAVHSIYPRPAKCRVPLAYERPLSLIVPYDGPSNLLWLVSVPVAVSAPASSRGSSYKAGRYDTPPTAGREEIQYRSKVTLWDDVGQTRILELGFREPVLGLRCRKDKLVIACLKRIILYRLDFGANTDRSHAVTKEGEYETVDNPKGLLDIATAAGSSLLAFPGRQVGHVQLVRLPALSHQAPFSTDRTSSKGKGPQVPPYSTIHIFLAHASALRTLTLSSTGNLLVTSSNKGTLLRIFDTRSKHLVRELRRGSDQADIWSVAVADPDRGHKVAAVSDKGTVHVWSVGDLTSTAVPSTKVPNQHSRERKKSSGSSSGNTALSAITAAGKGIRQLKPYLPAYFSSHWSDMSWRIPPTRPAPPSTASLANAASGVIGIAQAFSGTSSSEQSSGSQTRQHLDERLAEEDEVATCVFVPPISSSPHDSASRREAFNKDKEEQEYELIVVTRAGAWYRLGLNGTAAEAQAPTANLRKDGRSSRNRSSSAILQPHISNTTRRSDSARPKDTTDTSSSDGQLVMLEYRKLPFPDRGDGDVWSSDEEEPEDS